MPNSETSTIANIGDVPLSAPEPYLYYTYPKECLDFHFDVRNETDNFIRVLKVNYPDTTKHWVHLCENRSKYSVQAVVLTSAPPWWWIKRMG